MSGASLRVPLWMVAGLYGLLTLGLFAFVVLFVVVGIDGPEGDRVGNFSLAAGFVLLAAWTGAHAGVAFAAGLAAPQGARWVWWVAVGLSALMSFNACAWPLIAWMLWLALQHDVIAHFGVQDVAGRGFGAPPLDGGPSA